MLRQSTRPLKASELGLIDWIVALVGHWIARMPDPRFAVVIEGPVTHVWDLNGCQPSCCPNEYLFELDYKRYLVVWSWDLLNFKTTDHPTTHMRFDIAQNPSSLLAVAYAGDPIAVETRELDGDIPSTTEFRLVALEDLPPETWATIAAA